MADMSFLAAAQMNRMAHAVFGIVSAVDPTNHAIKVRVQPENIETGWMPDVVCVQSGNLKIAAPSSVGTHVVLIPIEGDAEQFIAIGSLFDSVVAPPHVPGSDRIVQPGEWLIRAGYGEQQQSLPGGGWILVSSHELSMGVENARISIKNTGINIVIDGVNMSITPGGVQVRGGDVQTDHTSLDKHFHFVGTQKSTGPTL